MNKTLLQFFVISALGVFTPALVFADSTLNGFDATPTSISSGQLVSLSWRSTDSSGVNLFLPCAAGIKYKESNDSLITCDTTVKLPVTYSKLVKVVNTSGSSVTISPEMVPLNADGTENRTQIKKAPVTVATNPEPIQEFTASPMTIASRATTTLTWVAPDVDRMNIKISCSENITPRLVGDDRPRVPCEQPIFLYDATGSGSAAFTLENSSLESVKIIFTLLPKISLTGGFDGTHAKSVEITILPPSQNKNPVVTSYFIDPTTLRSGERLAVSWDVLYAAGVNFELACSAGISATTSKSDAVASCGKKVFSDILSPKGSISVAFQNSLQTPQYVDLTLLPAITSTEYDRIGARVTHIVILGNQYGAVSSPVTQSTATNTKLNLATSTLSQGTGGSKFVFTKALAYGVKNSADVGELQKMLKAEGVYDGPVTGNFLTLTREGVKKFQKKYGFEQVGSVGPLTRKKLNEILSK